MQEGACPGALLAFTIKLVCWARPGDAANPLHAGWFGRWGARPTTNGGESDGYHFRAALDPGPQAGTRRAPRPLAAVGPRPQHAAAGPARHGSCGAAGRRPVRFARPGAWRAVLHLGRPWRRTGRVRPDRARLPPDRP